MAGGRQATGKTSQAQGGGAGNPDQDTSNITNDLTNNADTGGGGHGAHAGGAGGGGYGDGGGPRPPATPVTQTMPTVGNIYGQNGQVGFAGGPSNQVMQTAGQSFGNASRLQGAIPFWQSPTMQLGTQHGYDPGQTFASQRAGDNLDNANPFVSAALNNFNLNVAPGIQNQMNAAGLGRSTAAANAMARAQASMMPQLYSEAAQLQQNQINNQIAAGQFSAGLSQQDLGRAEGAAQFDLNMRQHAYDQGVAAQQQGFQNDMAMGGMLTGQQQTAGQGLFNMGQQAQQTGQSVYGNAYQDFLRQQGLSEEAINPFGGISGLLGTVTRGK